MERCQLKPFVDRGTDGAKYEVCGIWQPRAGLAVPGYEVAPLKVLMHPLLRYRLRWPHHGSAHVGEKWWHGQSGLHTNMPPGLSVVATHETLTGAGNVVYGNFRGQSSWGLQRTCIGVASFLLVRGRVEVRASAHGFVKSLVLARC